MVAPKHTDGPTVRLDNFPAIAIFMARHDPDLVDRMAGVFEAHVWDSAADRDWSLRVAALLRELAQTSRLRRMH